MSLGFHVDTGTVCRAKSIESCPFSSGGHVDTVSRLESFWVSVFTVVTGSLLVAFMLLVAVADIVSPLKV